MHVTVLNLRGASVLALCSFWDHRGETRRDLGCASPPSPSRHPHLTRPNLQELATFGDPPCKRHALRGVAPLTHLIYVRARPANLSHLSLCHFFGWDCC